MPPKQRGGKGDHRGTEEIQSFARCKESGSHPVEDIKFNVEDSGMKDELAVNQSNMPPKPGQGILGKRIKFFSNCFTMKAPSGYVYHYDIDIFSGNRSIVSDPNNAMWKKYRCLNTKRNREVVQKMMSENQHFSGSYGAYDGKKNLLSRIKLNIGAEGLMCPVELLQQDGDHPSGNFESFEVFVTPVQKKGRSDCSVNLDTLHAFYSGIIKSPPLDAIMAIETIIRHGPCLRFTPVGRSLFYPPLSTDLHPLGGGLEIWFGCRQSVRLGQWTPMVNLDMSSTAFFQERSMLDCVADLLGIEPAGLHYVSHIPDAKIRLFNNTFKNKQIEATHILGYRRKYRFLRLTQKPANKLELTLIENGVEVKKTVQRFFRETYSKELEYPHFPCIQVYPEVKKMYLPLEVCVLSRGQHYKKKLDYIQSAEVNRFTARPPSDRFHEIRNIRNERVKYEEDPLLNGYRMSVCNEPLQLEARILNLPDVLYKDSQGEKKITPSNGSWNMRETKYFRGAEINSWVLVNFANPRFCDDISLHRFANMFFKIAFRQGITISHVSGIETVNIRQISVETALRSAQEKYNADLAIVVLPGRSRQVYRDVKQAAEITLGLVTQCITDRNLTRNFRPQVISNLCQKINSKMGGVNNSLIPRELPPVMQEPFMIVGVNLVELSVLGPSPSVSIAAVVASLDKHPSRYAATVRAQKNSGRHHDVIVELKGMVAELLKAFYRHTRQQKPRRIIFYRVGVSECQFDTVRNHEIRAVRMACKEVQEDGYEPAITFVVIHYVTLKMQHQEGVDSEQGVGRMNNIPPGTTVDTVVTHPIYFDFFLCSHLEIQGTSHPRHYTVLHDDSNFSAEALQKLTFYLCHTYARTTRSISCPAPVMYAKLATERATRHLTDDDYFSGDESLSTASDNLSLFERVQKSITVIEGLEDTMYFV